MKIEYAHAQNIYPLDGPKAVLPVFFGDDQPTSLLDVGCGAGAWLRAAADMGISDFIGVDGVDIPADELLISKDRIRLQNLTEPWDLGRRFDAVFCLEVAEHLDEAHAEILIDALVKHSDRIFFSAACPGLAGQHHVNCQWPSYWQQLFNRRGYTCEDTLRWKIWNVSTLQPWYRQNIFVARRSPHKLEHEPIILPVIHPEIMEHMLLHCRNQLEPARLEYGEQQVAAYREQIVRGRMTLDWYLTVPFRAIWAKVRRNLS